jgi:hypothetical protein
MVEHVACINICCECFNIRYHLIDLGIGLDGRKILKMELPERDFENMSFVKLAHSRVLL